MNIVRPKISKHEISQILLEFQLFLEEKIEEKGDGMFVSSHEIRGSLEEEVMEHLQDVHKGDVKGQIYELFDIAVCAIWGIASLRKMHDV